MACKIVVAPHSERKASGEAYKTKRHSYPVSQRGYRDAIRHAKSGTYRGESSTVFLSCPRGDIRLLHCSDIGGATCKPDAELGGKSTRVLAGKRR